MSQVIRALFCLQSLRLLLKIMKNRHYKDLVRDREIRHTIVLVIVLFLVLITGIRLFHVIKAEKLVEKIPGAVVLKTEYGFWSGGVIVEFHTWEPYQKPEGGTLVDEGIHRAEVMNGKIVKVDDAPFP